MKRPELLLPIAAMLNAGSADRQIARTLACSKSTVTRNAVRIGRHAERMQYALLTHVDRIRETIIYDHFETFIGNQTNRLSLGTAVGSESGLVYDIRGVRYRAAIRRAYRKRPLQSETEPTEPGRMVGTVVETLETLVSKAPHGLTLISDDNPRYRAAVARLNKVLPAKRQIAHARFANPNRGPGHDQRGARRRDWAMFQVDVLHKLYRHSHSHQGRETIAFGRKLHNALARASLFAVWRNLVKLITERRPTSLTPAIRAGVTDRVWTWADVFSERLFEARI